MLEATEEQPPGARCRGGSTSHIAAPKRMAGTTAAPTCDTCPRTPSPACQDKPATSSLEPKLPRRSASMPSKRRLATGPFAEPASAAEPMQTPSVVWKKAMYGKPARRYAPSYPHDMRDLDDARGQDPLREVDDDAPARCEAMRPPVRRIGDVAVGVHPSPELHHGIVAQGAASHADSPRGEPDADQQPRRHLA